MSASPELQQKFEKAQIDVKGVKKKPSNDLLLRLYAHYKQGTEGDVFGERPGFTEFEKRAKWDAWLKIKGMTEDDAKTAYVKLVERVIRDDE